MRGCLHLAEKGYKEAIKLLEDRYGNKIRLVDSYLERVRAWSKVAEGDVEALDQFVLFLTEVQSAMSSVALGEFNHPANLRLIMSKLPPPPPLPSGQVDEGGRSDHPWRG